MNSDIENARLKIFTWHIHGSYLFYLSQGEYDIYIPVNNEKSEGYYGRGQTFPFGKNVIEVPASEVRKISTTFFRIGRKDFQGFMLNTIRPKYIQPIAFI